MSWQKIRFRVDANQVETISAILEAFLAQSITTENAGEDDFFEIAFPGTPDWQHVYVSALFDEQVDAHAIITFVNETLKPAEPFPADIEKLIDQDWERVWLSSFEPTRVGNKLWVCPSWLEPPHPEHHNIILDPGLAFGTGTHATTHLCLQWISKHQLTGKNVLDYGAGSGILAIASLLCGAEQAWAVDIDPLAVQASDDNAQRNQVADKLQSMLPDALPSEVTTDIVIANILADVIIDLSDTLLNHLNSDGILLLTGILNEQSEKVKNAFSGKIDFTEQSNQGWSLLIGTRICNNSR